MLVTLKEILTLADSVAAFNVFGYEDTAAVLRAAASCRQPVILMTNKPAVDFMPLEVLGPMLVTMAKAAPVPVCVHLDHSTNREDICRAIDAGYTSVMFDGSQLPLEENIAKSREIVELAHPAGVSVEAEIGSVGYADPSVAAKAAYTDPEQAVRFAEEVRPDALAVAVGTVHRMQQQTALLDFELLHRLRQCLTLPLVIHGSSGVPDADIIRLCKAGVSKMNFGTALRMTFGNTLRQTMADRPTEFDRLKLFVPSMDAVAEKAAEKFRLVAGQEETT